MIAKVVLIAFLANCALGAEDIPCDGDKICLKDVVESTFSPKSFNASWISDHELFMLDEESNFIIHDVDTGESHLLINSDELKALHHKKSLLYAPVLDTVHLRLRPHQEETEETKGIEADKYSLSPDRKFLLFANSIEPKRGSILRAVYLVYSIERRSVTYLHPANASDETKLQYASFGSVGSQLLFIHEFDVYYAPSAEDVPVKILESPPGHQVYHLLPDWVYPDGESPQYSFSEDGSQLAAISYDNGRVREASFSFYGDSEDVTNQYAEDVRIKYPKPGTPIATTNVTIINLTNGNYTSKSIPPSERFGFTDVYLSFAEWMTNDTFLIGWQNRVWNESNAEVCTREASNEVNSDSSDSVWTCREIFYYKLDYGWIELVAELAHSEGFFTRYPVRGPSGHLFEHVAHVSKEGKLDILTSGDFQVVSLLGYNDTDQFVYFIGTEPKRPRSRQFYRVHANSTNSKPECITCSDCCKNNEIEFSDEMTYYVSTCSGPSVPKVQIKRTADHSVVTTWEDNMNLTTSLASKSLPKEKQYKVHLSGSHFANVRVYLPPNLTTDGSIKVPMIVYVYGGPSEQIVSDDFDVGFSTYMAASRGIVYAKMDVRGGGLEGLNKTFEMYRKMGNVEIGDFNLVARFLRNSFPYIDRSKIAIWGWSYGGYATLRSLILDDKADPVFCCGVAVAPVTNWLYYHAGYVERMIGMPQDNLEYYRESSVVGYASQLQNKSLLLVHGTKDDNVHFQHSALLMKALVAENVKFQSQIYIDEDHHMGNVYAHLFDRIDKFFVEVFGL